VRGVTLDDVWAEAESVLPRRFELHLTSNGRGTYHAVALPPFLPWEEWWAEHREAFGDTPVQAVSELVEKLRGRFPTEPSA
jgi:hypothetical protein